jgi:hypothetical protein
MQNLITIEMIDDWAGAAMQGFVSAKARDKDLDLGALADAAYAMAREMARARGEFIDDHEEDLAPSDGSEQDDEDDDLDS